MKFIVFIFTALFFLGLIPVIFNSCSSRFSANRFLISEEESVDEVNLGFDELEEERQSPTNEVLDEPQNTKIPTKIVKGENSNTFSVLSMVPHIVKAAIPSEIHCKGDTHLEGNQCVNDFYSFKKMSFEDLVDHLIQQQVGGYKKASIDLSAKKTRVRTKAELLKALKNSSFGEIIYVEGDANIDLSGVWDIKIPSGITLASNRGENGSKGGILYTSTREQRELFRVMGPKVRITGLRFRGPFDGIEDPGCGGNDAIGIQISSRDATGWDVEIDNNEFRAWPRAAVSFSKVSGGRVHHNHIQFNRKMERTPGCRAYGLGYGVVVSRAHTLIEFNLFNNNRHDIASTGYPGSAYTARFNVISDENAISHNFDIHGHADRPTHPDFDKYPGSAGKFLLVEKNIFIQKIKRNVVIRGVPTVGAYIRGNHHNRLGFDWIFQLNNYGNIFKRDNQLFVDRNNGPLSLLKSHIADFN